MMAKESMRLVFVAIFYVGFTYGSSRSHVLRSHRNAIVHQPPVRLQEEGICESEVTANGYPCKEYQVKTEDGYILTLHNIPGGHLKNGSRGGRTQPVLLQHGLMVDGMTWFMGNPDQALGYILADNGFDVWIANTRGTRLSRQHATLNASTPAYWAWTWDELAQYELPTIVGFVQKQTGQKVHYVGHSLGTLMALASFSEGKLVDMLKSAALLSPIAYLNHITTPLGQLAARAFLGEIANNLLGIPELNPREQPVIDFVKSLCARPGIDCFDLATALLGKNCCLNSSTINLFLKYEPQSTSTRNLVHLSQTVRDGFIRKFDYGSSAANMARYSQPIPPLYNMTNVPSSFPLFLSYGGQDALSDVFDVRILLDNLKAHDSDKLTVQFVENFAHGDFILGTTAKSVVYDPMISFFNRHMA